MSSALETRVPAARAHILVVEDEPDLLSAITDLLGDEGYQVSTAEHGAEALAFLTDHPAPDLILLDIAMPVMDGVVFRRLQRADPRLLAIPTVAVTADAFDRIAALNVAAWLAKPISADELLEAVEHHRTRRGLAAPDHTCHFYQDAAALAADTAAYFAPSLRAGDGALAIAGAAHWQGVADHLARAGLDLAAARAAGRIVLIDPEEAARQVVLGPDIPAGAPDVSASHFRALIEPAIERARAGSGRARIYGELVDFLNRRGQLDAALEVESLWNQVLGETPCPLRCAYRVAATGAPALDRDPTIARICAHHAAHSVIPAAA